MGREASTTRVFTRNLEILRAFRLAAKRNECRFHTRHRYPAMVPQHQRRRVFFGAVADHQLSSRSCRPWNNQLGVAVRVHTFESKHLAR